jgi:DNA-binding MarR family transcriptional regulator
MSTSQQPLRDRTHGQPETSPVSHLGAQVGRFMRQAGLLRAQMAKNDLSGIEWSAYSVLFWLVSDGAMRPGALAETMCADPSTISRQTAALIEHGLVERQPDPDDGRAALLVATDRGRTTLADMRAARDALFEAVLVGWSAEDVSLLGDLLGRFTADLEQARPGLRKRGPVESGSTEPATSRKETP